jgi:TIR domain
VKELDPAVTTDVFISHASEDKDEVARPLAEELTRRGFRVWYDECSLRVGDSLREKIDEGLRTCTFGLVVISPSFMAKPWPNREVNGLVVLETGDGRKRILPVWHLTSAEEVAQWSPTIADLKAITTDRGLDVVADEIARVLRTVGRERLAEELRGLLRADRQIRAVAAELDVRLCDDPGVGWAGWSIWPAALDTHLRYLNKTMLELDAVTARLNAYQVDREIDRERRDLEQLSRDLRDTAERYFTGTITTYRASSGEVLPIPPNRDIASPTLAGTEPITFEKWRRRVLERFRSVADRLGVSEELGDRIASWPLWSYEAAGAVYDGDGAASAKKSQELWAPEDRPSDLN